MSTQCLVINGHLYHTPSIKDKGAQKREQKDRESQIGVRAGRGSASGHYRAATPVDSGVGACPRSGSQYSSKEGEAERSPTST